MFDDIYARCFNFYKFPVCVAIKINSHFFLTKIHISTAGKTGIVGSGKKCLQTPGRKGKNEDFSRTYATKNPSEI